MKTTNKIYMLVAGIVRFYMVGALVISFMHIITAAHQLGLGGWQAYTVPFAIDGFALLGMIGRSRRFAASTQRTGFYLQLAAGIVSLAANVYAGENLGERIYGVLIVAAFIVAEWYAGKLQPAPTAEANASERRSQAAKKAAATRRANTEKKAAEKKAAQKKAAADRRRARQAEDTQVDGADSASSSRNLTVA